MTKKIKLKIKDHITKKGLNQKDFATETKLREATVSQLVNNKYDRVELKHILTIMQYFDITDFNEIFEIVDEED